LLSVASLYIANLNLRVHRTQTSGTGHPERYLLDGPTLPSFWPSSLMVGPPDRQSTGSRHSTLKSSTLGSEQFFTTSRLTLYDWFPLLSLSLFTRGILKHLKRVQTLCSSNKVTWADIANVALESFFDLQQGAWIFSAYHSKDIFVDGDVYTLPADNVEADRWASCSGSCNLFCRCCKVVCSSLPPSYQDHPLYLTFLG